MFARYALILLIALGSSGLASAEEPQASEPEARSWQTRFDAAYATLARGDFQRATIDLKALTKDAPDDASAARLHALIKLSGEWAERGYTLVLGSEAMESIKARGDRRRTKGEIAGLYVDSVLYGLGTGGWLASLLETDSAAGIILPSLALAGGSAGLLYHIDRTPLGYGVARSASTGLRLGLLEGLAWMVWNESRAGSGLGVKVNTSLIWGLSTLGMVGGGYVGHRLGATPGAASMVESGATWSALTSGLLTYGVLGDAVEDEAFFLAAAIGLNLGAVGAGLLAAESAPSIARVRYLDLGALSGGVLFGGLFVALSDMADTRSAQVASLVTAVGLGAGLATSWLLTRDMPKDAFVARPTVSWTPTMYPTQDGINLGAVGTF